MSGRARLSGGLEVWRDGVAEARRRWPAVAFHEVELLRSVEERALGDASHAAEIYLAYACGRGDPAAIAAFEVDYFPEVDAVVTRVGPSVVLTRDELRQRMREKLFVGSEEAPPVVLAYAGRGSLRNWLRVVAMRTALKLVRGADRVVVDADMLLEQPDAADHPELAYLKGVYHAEFKQAFREAMDTLSFRDQNLVRYAPAEGLDSAAIASIYGTHKATVNRWLAGVRDSLFSAVRTRMMEKLNVDPAEFESILRLIRSGLELTLPHRR
jgi:RNA polymerase sigma-70 factor (ECF subfamily)